MSFCLLNEGVAFLAQKDWVLLIFLSLLLVTAAQRFLFPTYFHAFFRYTQFVEIQDNQALFYVINPLGLFCLEALALFFVFDLGLTETFFVYLSTVGVLFALFFIKSMSTFYLLRLHQNSSFVKRVFRRATFLRFWKFVVLFIILFLFFYAKIPVNVTALTIAFVWVFFVLIDYWIYFQKHPQVSYYIFLYLCTFEILPLLILYKIGWTGEFN